MMTAATLRIGTRGSQLARWQADWVADRLRKAHPGLDVELVEIKTQGDRDRNSPLAAIGGLGLFTKEIQRALVDGTVEVAVHSLKDLPTRGPDGLTLGAVPAREDVADALIAPALRTLDALPDGATVGTGSLRRRAQLLHARPDLNVVGVRGNVETRLNQALGGPLDAVVLAEAGCVGSGSTGTSPSGSARPGSCRRSGRGPSGSSAGMTTSGRPSPARPAGRPGDPSGGRGRASHAGRAGRRLHDPPGRLGAATRPRASRSTPPSSTPTAASGSRRRGSAIARARTSLGAKWRKP